MADSNDDNARNLLIDFNSPLQGRLNKSLYGDLIPLVPSPKPIKTNANVKICDLNTEQSDDEDNNPFDFVDHQTNLNVRKLNDPFELAYYLSDGNDKELFNASIEDTVKEIDEEKEVVANSTEVDLQDISNVSDNSNHDAVEFLDQQICDRTGNSSILIEDVTDPGIDVCVSFSDISPVPRAEEENARGFEKHIEDEDNSIAYKEVSSTEALDNSEEAIKAIVANRVNACIQNALHQSKLYYDNFAFNQEHALVPVKHNTSYPHNCSKSDLNVSTTDITSAQIYKDPTAINPILKCNWNTPQRNVSYVESLDGFNSAFCNPSRYLCSNTRPENMNSSVSEIMKITSPLIKIKPDLLECVGNMELKNSSCFGALCSSDSRYDRRRGNLLTNFKKQVPARITGYGSNEMSSTFLDSEGFPDVSYKNKKGKNDDSVFLEAHNVAFMFGSFSESPSDGEEDILACKPEWERSNLKLPKFNSEEDDTESVTGVVDCKLSSYSEILAKYNTLISHKDNKHKEVMIPPDILPVVLPETDGNIRIKSKQLQQTGKKGPIKAIVPLGSMVRPAGVGSKVSPSNGGNDNMVFGGGSVTSVKHQTTSQLEVFKNEKSILSKSDTASKKGSHITASAQSSDVSAGGIPLVSPAVSLKNKESFLGKHNAQEMSKLSSSIAQFNLSGLMATSTPARKISYSTSTRNLMKTMPSPILVKVQEKQSPPIETSRIKKPKDVLKNKSFDGDQRGVKNKGLPNKLHSRSKSASSVNPKQVSQKENSPQHGKYLYKKISVLSDKNSRSYKTQPHTGILKPLKLNGQSMPRKQNVEMKVGTTQNKKSTLQLFSKLKKNSLLEMDKENVKPVA